MNRNKNKGRGAYPWQYEDQKGRPKEDKNPTVSVYNSARYGTRYFAGRTWGKSMYVTARDDK